MSEEKTQDMPDERSFEARVFARFDALDARLQKLEAESERRAVETKPFWERALAEIMEGREDLSAVRQDVGEIKEAVKDLSRKILILNKDMVQLRSDQLGLEERVEELEAELAR